MSAPKESFLGSLLKSIGEPPEFSSTSPNVARPIGKPSPPALTNGAGRNGTTPSTATKRKADGDLDGAKAKTQRTDGQPNGRPAVPPLRPSASTPTLKTPTATAPRPIYQGTARPSTPATASSKPTPKTAPSLANGPKPAPKAAPSTAPKASSASTAAAHQPAPRPTLATAQPKKGSFAEILARAQAAQQHQPVVGAIKHKAVERITKKERLAALEAAKKQSKDGKKASQSGRSRSPEPASHKPGESAKARTKPTAPAYQGTMRRTAQPVYQGTMGLSSKPAGKPPLDRGPSDRSRSNSAQLKSREKGVRYAGTAYYSRDEDSAEEDDYGDYESDASSDMEAGAFDLDHEEEFSLRAAKKEDAEALREEESHKREKAKRREMLQKMAANAAKKKRY